jgi:hypothetical protein
MVENTLGTEEVVSQIDMLYDKAKYAIKLVQLYSKSTNKRLLNNISTIAPLNSGVYGLYNSGENKKVIGPAASSKIKFKFGDDVLKSGNIHRLPNSVIKQYMPDLDDRQIAPSDIIHVNVNRIVKELGDGPAAIIEIASTIVHEATHEIEFQTRGKTDEIGPRKAEQDFKSWVSANRRLVSSRIPQISL